MKIQEKISIDLKKSMLSGDSNKKNLLRTILGEFNRIDKNITDDKAISIIKKMKENAEINKDQKEIEILNDYLPVMINQEDIDIFVDDLFKKNNFTQKDIGKIMKEIKNNFGNSVDMKIASLIVKKYLN